MVFEVTVVGQTNVFIFSTAGQAHLMRELAPQLLYDLVGLALSILFRQTTENVMTLVRCCQNEE